MTALALYYSEIRKWQIAGKAVALLWQALPSSELEGIMVRGTAVDRFGKVLHARCGELPSENFDRTPHGLGGGVLVIPHILEKHFVGNELVRASSQSRQKPERKGVAETAGAVGPADTERVLVDDGR
jgi:hypothetical protein